MEDVKFIKIAIYCLYIYVYPGHKSKTLTFSVSLPGGPYSQRPFFHFSNMYISSSLNFGAHGCGKDISSRFCFHHSVFEYPQPKKSLKAK